MSLEKILNKILNDAHAEADGIVKESKIKADEIKKTALDEAKQMEEALLAEYKRQAKLEASRVVTQARLERKIDLLACRKELINEVLDKAFKKEKISKEALKRKIVLKDGEKEEYFDEQNLKDELRQQLECFIAEALKL